MIARPSIKTSLTTLAAALAIALAPAPALANPADDQLATLIDEIWANTLKEAPEFASSLGVESYAGLVSDYSLEAEDRQVQAARGYLARLDAIDTAALSPAPRTDHAIMRRSLSERIEGASFPQRAVNFTNRSGWHQGFAELGNSVPLRTLADYVSYNDRIAQYGRVNDQAIAVANRAIADKVTLPCDSLSGYETSISGLISASPEQSRFYEPFTKAKPAAISDADWAREQARARATIATVIEPALINHRNWFLVRYKPACAVAPGVSSQPRGADYYNFRIRQMTTTNYTADQIHQIGLGEVARIRAEMETVATRAGYPTREAFIQHLRTDPQYYAKTPEELMERVARVTKTIDGKMPSLFGRLPRLPYGLKEIPAEIAEGTTTAYYGPGSPDVGLSGTYYVNTSKLDQRPFWEIPALSVHEGVPGHHHQIALQQELEMHDFRKHGAFFTAFVEGWGLYSERLGIEMGLYDTPATDMGRLSYEMWRATRLVVDTGIHSKGWSKAQAIAYMTDNTALSSANIEAEVNRYISWPGQALAYKIGELKIRELRSFAEAELGAKFDLRFFHDAVLAQGAVPLDVLDAQVRAWIAAEKAKG